MRVFALLLCSFAALAQQSELNEAERRPREAVRNVTLMTCGDSYAGTWGQATHVGKNVRNTPK